MNFCYDCKGKTIKIDTDNSSYPIIYHVDNTHLFYYKKQGEKIFLTQEDVNDLRKFGKWCIEHNNADFGLELNEFFNE